MAMPNVEVADLSETEYCTQCGYETPLPMVEGVCGDCHADNYMTKENEMCRDDKYAEARINLDGAIAEFFKAARDIGMSNTEIARDVCDSLFEGSDGDVKMSGDIDI